MALDDLSLKRADNVFQELRSRFDSGLADAGIVEATTFVLDHIISHFQESYYRPHLGNIRREFLSFLNPDLIDSLSYEALGALSRVLRKIEKPFPDEATSEIDTGTQAIYKSLAKRHIAAGDEEGAGDHIKLAGFEDIPGAITELRREIEATMEDQTSGTISIPVTQQPLNSLPSLTTGNMVRGELDIEITGEWSIIRRRKPVVAFDGRIL